MGESKRRKTAMGDDYGKSPNRWEVDKLLINLIRDNYTDLIRINSDGFAQSGKGVVMAVYPETNPDSVDGQLFYLPQDKFLEAMQQLHPVSHYPKIIPGSTVLFETYDPLSCMVLGLFGGVKPFVMMLSTQSDPEDLIEQIKSQVMEETAPNN